MYDPSYMIEELAKKFDELQENSRIYRFHKKRKERADFLHWLADAYWSNIRKMQERPLRR